MDRIFSLAEAGAFVPRLRHHVDTLIVLRADLADARAALVRGDMPSVGGLPEVKALEARLQESVDWFATQGLQLKGIAPVIADFPSMLDGAPVLLCWLEGETELGWYHDAELGFLGRRPLPEQA